MVIHTLAIRNGRIASPILDRMGIAVHFGQYGNIDQQ